MTEQKIRATVVTLVDQFKKLSKMGSAQSKERQSLEIACETHAVMLAAQVLVDLHNIAASLDACQLFLDEIRVNVEHPR